MTCWIGVAGTPERVWCAAVRIWQLAAAGMFYELRERLALDILHHQVIRTNIVQRADVGMVERGDGARFAVKAVVELARGMPPLPIIDRSL
jgi:hypothetical protein